MPRPRFGDALQSVAQCALQERDRWILWLPVALGLGISLYFTLSREPSSALGFALGGSGILVGVVACGTEAAFARGSLAFMAALLIGFSLAKHRTDAVAAPVLAHRLGPVLVEGRVENAQAHGKSVRVVLTLARAGHLRSQQRPKRVRISIRSGADGLKPGDWIDAKAVLMPPPEPAAPGDYDFGRAAFFRQIGAVGFTYGRPTKIAPLRKAGPAARLTTAVELLRWRVSARIHSILPGSTGAIASALITGDRGGISDEDESALRDAGLAHVLAIAGLHMALVGLGLFWAARAFLALFPAIALTQPIKKWAAVAALGSATFYLVISGAATPATRAYIMLAAMLIAILFDRPAISMRSVAIAATIILLLEPETLIEPGFQMSFAAVVGLVAVAEWERARERSESSWLPLPTVRRYLRGIATTSFVGSIATAPFAAFHFDRATHFAVIGNLGAMPIMGFVTMPAAALALFLMPFGLDEYPLRVMGRGIELMLTVGRWVSDLPGSVSFVSAWPVSALVSLTLGGLWIGLWRRRWRWLGLLPIVAAAALVLTSAPPDILVARDGITIAVRGADEHLHFIRPPADKYSAEEWLKRDGDARTLEDAVVNRTATSCDAYSCTTQVHGLRIAATFTPAALEEDCAMNQIALSAVPTRHRCKGPALVVDRFDVARNGAYAIWLTNGIEVDTAQARRGLRPWSAPPPRRQYRRMRPTSLPWMRTRSAP
ncbi:MAG TPA: ComEC/Rec2 family competence protein [Rhizomicrobium sp.]